MGVDLHLLPFESDHPGNRFSHSVLNCWRRRELWDEISKLPSVPIDPEMPQKTRKDFKDEADGKKKPLRSERNAFYSFLATGKDGEHCYGETTHDPYGSPLRYVFVVDLMKVREHEGVTDNARNRAIWAYLAELPGDTKVALYWH